MMTRARRLISASELQNMDKLTRKQRDAVELVAEGMTTTEIARKLGATPDAIYTRIATASRRLNVSDRRGLVRAIFPAHCTPQSPPPMREHSRLSTYTGQNAAPHSYTNRPSRPFTGVSPRKRKTRVSPNVEGNGGVDIVSSARARHSSVGIITGEEFLKLGAALRRTQLTLQNQIDKLRRSRQTPEASRRAQLMCRLDLVTEELAALTHQFLTGLSGSTRVAGR